MFIYINISRTFIHNRRIISDPGKRLCKEFHFLRCVELVFSVAFFIDIG